MQLLEDKLLEDIPWTLGTVSGHNRAFTNVLSCCGATGGKMRDTNVCLGCREGENVSIRDFMNMKKSSLG